MDVIGERWLGALRSHQRGLPQPVAIAMVEAVGKAPLGDDLRKIEDALIHLETADLQEITGSEARVLVAILRQMDDELTQLETRLNYLWEKP
ncbi:MAG: hypothetical protein HY070_03745 [Chloroflexi bacterium]|nr:hypothetical protein [Chloroflexota bacterium]